MFNNFFKFAFFLLLFFACSSGLSQEEAQQQIDQAVNDVLATTSTLPPTTTTTSTTTTLPPTTTTTSTTTTSTTTTSTTTTTTTTTTLPPTTTTTTTTTTTLPPTTTTTSTTTTTTLPSLFPSEPASSTWIRYSGNGSQIIDVSNIGDALQIVSVDVQSSTNFIVYAYDANFENKTLLVNEIGTFKVVELVNELGYSSSRKLVKKLEIKSNGSWEFVFKPIASSRNFESSSISGTRNEVIEAYFLKNEKVVLNISHNGESNFIIYGYDCNGKRTGLLVNEIGNVSGTYLTSLNTCYLKINAQGSWTLSK